MQARVKEVTAHEDELAAWKQRFKAEALRQIGERERALSEWQAQLEAQGADLTRLRSDTEACLALGFRCLIQHGEADPKAPYTCEEACKTRGITLSTSRAGLRLGLLMLDILYLTACVAAKRALLLTTNSFCTVHDLTLSCIRRRWRRGRPRWWRERLLLPKLRGRPPSATLLLQPAR